MRMVFEFILGTHVPDRYLNDNNGKNNSDFPVILVASLNEFG